LGLLFRLQEFAISLGWAPWSDLGRVDILNCIGMSMMLMGLMCWGVLTARVGRTLLSDRPFSTRHATMSQTPGLRPFIAAAILLSAAIALLTPLLWTAWHPNFLPWQIETYINGVHSLGAPQSWLFPIFPWTAFAFAGLAFGFILMTGYAKK